MVWRGDDPGHQAAFAACARARCRSASTMPSSEPNDEAQQRRGKRHPGVIDEAARAVIGAAVEHALQQLGRHLVRRRQHRALQRPWRRRPLGDASRPSRQPSSWRDDRHVQPDRGDVPDHQQQRARTSTGTGSRACGRHLSRHSCARRAAPRAPGARRPGTPASRARRACALGGRSHSITSMMRPGPRRHHHDPGRQEHRLGDRVGDEDHGLAGRAPTARSSCSFSWSRTISSSAPNGSSISSSSGSKRQRAGDRDALLHAARELPGKLAARSPARSTSSRYLRARARAARPPACP